MCRFQMSSSCSSCLIFFGLITVTTFFLYRSYFLQKSCKYLSEYHVYCPVLGTDRTLDQKLPQAGLPRTTNTWIVNVITSVNMM